MIANAAVKGMSQGNAAKVDSSNTAIIKALTQTPYLWPVLRGPDYLKDDIFIDDDGAALEGSGAGHHEVKDDLESSGSGYGPDDEDGDGGSEPGRSCVFTSGEEQTFVDHIVAMFESGFPITTFDLRCIVKAYWDSIVPLYKKEECKSNDPLDTEKFYEALKQPIEKRLLVRVKFREWATHTHYVLPFPYMGLFLRFVPCANIVMKCNIVHSQPKHENTLPVNEDTITRSKTPMSESLPPDSKNENDHPGVGLGPENTQTDNDSSDNNHHSNGVYIMNRKPDERATSFFAQPGILAGYYTKEQVFYSVVGVLKQTWVGERRGAVLDIALPEFALVLLMCTWKQHFGGCVCGLEGIGAGAAVIGGAVVGLLCAILVVMFIVYRMRKKDEGSYALDEPKRSPTVNSYTKNSNREFYA
uniref:Syndecan n=1 Tax=Timema cristinae TaxID=61476 RepID=A0A7R9D4V6_TIMCR|nr:unnamed protein product [Timema cristinae]